MLADCHMHMILDGVDFRKAMGAQKLQPRDALIRPVLEKYREQGITFLRDGGDAWGVSLRARELAPEYGIDYRSPAFPIHKKGYYGHFIGIGFTDLKEYRQLVQKAKTLGADFIKIMISGLMDFNRFGVLTCPGLSGDDIRSMIDSAHQAGFSVMAHANGAETVIQAAMAGVDSVEHGAYLNEEALCAMKEAGCVWVPTLATFKNLVGVGRFPDEVLQQIGDAAVRNIKTFAAMGGSLACGSDAGAYGVLHAAGALHELQYMKEAIGSGGEDILASGTNQIQTRFHR